jgi:hypothetical protein
MSQETARNDNGERDESKLPSVLEGVLTRREVLRRGAIASTVAGVGLSAAGGNAAATSSRDSSDEHEGGQDGEGGYSGELTLASPDLGGFDKTLMYIAEGVTSGDWDRIERGDFFQTEIMGRSEEEIQELDREAAAFFEETFGLPFEGEDLGDGNVETIDDDVGGGAQFFRFMQNPETEYRVYVISGERVSEDGALVRDGGHFVSIQEEMTLHGEWGGEEGTSVPAGSFLVFGDYNIDPENIRGRSDPIEIHYESGSPIIPGMDPFTFSCVITHPEWGEGKANGTVIPGEQVEGGTTNHIRNVLTFPAVLN